MIKRKQSFVDMAGTCIIASHGGFEILSLLETKPLRSGLRYRHTVAELRCDTTNSAQTKTACIGSRSMLYGLYLLLGLELGSIACFGGSAHFTLEPLCTLLQPQLLLLRNTQADEHP